MPSSYCVYLFFVTFACTGKSFAFLEADTVAVEGEVAFLPCRASTAAKDIVGQLTLLQWYHSRYHKPIYTLDLRSSNSTTLGKWAVLGGKHFPSPESEGRLYLDLTPDPLVLRIDPVHYEDAGRYKCQIEFKNHRSLSNVVGLQVIVPPKGVIVKDESGRKLEGVIGPYSLGETLKIKCESIGGYPVPNLTWTVGSRDSGNDFVSTGVSVNRSSVVISSLKRAHQWSHYTCTAGNSRLTSSKSETVVVELNLPPVELLLSKISPKPLVAGRLLHMACQSKGSHPKAHIHWYKSGHIVHGKEKISNNGNVTTSHVALNLTSSDNGQAVECYATNPRIPNFILKKTFPLHVNYKPEVTVMLDKPVNEILEGSNLTLRCMSKANPEVWEKTWKFQGYDLLHENSTLFGSHFITIHNAKPSQSGTYTCTAVNREGQASSSIYIDVKYPPRCRYVKIFHHYYPAGSDENRANVTCMIAARPTNVTFYWMLRHSSSNYSWTSGQSPYTEVKWKDSIEELYCWGKSEIGTQEIPCQIVLSKGHSGKLSTCSNPIQRKYERTFI